MKDYILAGVALLFFLTCSPAMSAGAETGAYNWTGFYAGLNAGGAVNSSQYTISPTGNFLTPADALHNPADNPSRTASEDFSTGAFTGGGQIGYNYQYGRFVFGLETDFNYNGVDESKYAERPFFPLIDGSFIHTVTQKVDYFGTFRGRLGYTPSDRFMVFGTFGLAYGDVSSRSDILFTSGTDHYLGSSSGFQAGWAAGAGAEYALTRCITMKIEYLYIDLGSNSYTYGQQNPEFAGYTYTTQMDTAEHVIRVGINYKFF